MEANDLENLSIKSRYMLLQICFTTYSKITILSNLMPHYNNLQDIGYLRFSMQMLKQSNFKYFSKIKELGDLELSTPLNFVAGMSAKEFERSQIRKVELAKEINELNYKHPGCLFSLEESLYLFDFFDKLSL